MTLPELWLPIVLTAVAIFILSAIAWMALPHHKKDFGRHPDEDAFMASGRDTKPGRYMFPFCADPAEMKSDDFKARWKSGPHGVLTIWNGPPNMGKNLLLTFIFYTTVAVFVAYLTTLSSLAPGDDFRTVFRFTGTAAVSAFAFGGIPQAIWFNKSLRAFFTDLADNIVYGLTTGVVFALCWPGA
jgi:hypothetical protein